MFTLAESLNVASRHLCASTSSSNRWRKADHRPDWLRGLFSSRRQGLWNGLTLGLLTAMLVGCHLPIGGPTLIASPLDQQAQEAAVLEIVPLGTHRDAVVPQLEAAGITGNFGTRDTIYYCNLWQRESGAVWQMNVALLFDEDGRVYKTRTANAETAVE